MTEADIGRRGRMPSSNALVAEPTCEDADLDNTQILPTAVGR
jgi:hypothetical protein